MSNLECRSAKPATGGRVAVMPIHPRYANAILGGTKSAEFQKRRLAPDIQRIVVYETAPTSLIVGEFWIGETVLGSPDEIWRAYASTGEISKQSFHEYFAGRDTAVAFVVTRAQRYAKPIALADLHPRPGVPQSTIYLPAEVIDGR